MSEAIFGGTWPTDLDVGPWHIAASARRDPEIASGQGWSCGMPTTQHVQMPGIAGHLQELRRCPRPTTPPPHRTN